MNACLDTRVCKRFSNVGWGERVFRRLVDIANRRKVS